MAAEHHESVPELSAIRIQRADGQITFVFETEERPVARLTLPVPGTLSFNSSSGSDRPDSETSATPSVGIEERASGESAGRESERTAVLSGRLKSTPREGKADRSGNPTAWARFAAHEEGQRDARFYIATFHRHTARIALGLPREVRLTVEGYLHRSNDPTGRRLDTISVFNLIAYPGKRERA